MLKSAQINNFQSVKDLFLDLDHPIVVITGPTDEGKSAILRAIKNAAFDGVGGNFFRKETNSDGVCVVNKTMSVELKADTGSVKWLKSKTDATYIINEDDRRENCGRVVPEEVPKALGLTSEASVGENLHYRSQFDAAFLLKDRGAKDCYRFISKLMGADVVISAVNALEKNSRELAKAEKSAEAGLKDLQKGLDSYFTEEEIVQMTEQKDLISQKVKDHAALNKKQDSLLFLKGLFTDHVAMSVVLNDRSKEVEAQAVVVQSIKQTKESISSAVAKLVQVVNIKTMNSDFSEIKDRLDNASWLDNINIKSMSLDNTNLFVISKRLSSLTDITEKHREIVAIELPKLSSVEVLKSMFNEYRKKKEAITLIVDSYSSVKILDKDISRAEIELADLEKQLPAKLAPGSYVVKHGSSEMAVTVSGNMFVPDFNDFSVEGENEL